MEKIDSPYWNIKCAGMPERCKELFLAKVNQKDLPDEEKERMSEDVKNFMYDEKGNLKKASIDDFKVGLLQVYY